MTPEEIYKQGGREGFIAGFQFLMQLQYSIFEKLAKQNSGPESQELLDMSKKALLTAGDCLESGLDDFEKDWGRKCCGPGSYLVEKGVVLHPDKIKGVGE